MTDGNTATVAPAIISPITEDEMFKVHDILTRAANAIVGMSALTEQVQRLSSQVQAMSQDMDKLRRTNDMLEESLSHGRQVRTELETKLSQSQSALSVAESERDRAKSDAEHANAALDRTVHELSEAQRSRDDAYIQIMELEDELKAHKTKLDAIRDGYASIFGVPAIEPPKHQPRVQAQPQPELMQVPDPIYNQEPVSAVVDDSPDTSKEWLPGYTWDSGLQLYTKPKPSTPVDDKAWWDK